MPFPWNKNRFTPFSQIVTDLHSTKRGGSLVVETGFPTSLIDLFVKNRSRFKKSKSRKSVQPQPEFNDSPPSPPPPPATAPPYRASFVTPLAETQSLKRTVSENDVSGQVSDRVPECETGSGVNIGVAVLVKMFVVFVLVANVKMVTVGITVSAFALVFLEYAGKCVVSPFSNANVAKMEYLSKRVSVSACVLRFQKLLQLKVKKNNCEVASVQLGSSTFTSMDEIEVVESNCEVGICFVDGNELDSMRLDWVDESPMKVVEPCGISECKTKGNSRSGRFKSKMVKKFVPKKFLRSKKEKEEKRSIEVFEVELHSEVSSVVDEDKSPSFEIEREEEESLLLLTTKLEYVRDDDDGKEEKVNCGITCSQESFLAKEEVSNEKRIERVGNSDYTILLVIALAGLVVGRLPALIFTITWCFILKLLKTLGRSKNAFHQMFCSKLLMEH